MDCYSLFHAKLTLLGITGAFVAYHDVRYREIPHAAVVTGIVGGLAIHYHFGQLTGVVASVEGLVTAFCVTLWLYALGLMSAGDVKWFAAAGSVVNSGHLLDAFKWAAAAGALLAIAAWLRSRQTDGLPYGLAIAAGSIAGIAGAQ